ncbi:hypothetical protein RCOM_0371350 [Ricinus communis]|uniref:PA domain-containing protein n=1 Tax=Ricinus communis TaxID=3988 RepID=B9T0Z3_RICCO|nr:hypothetical protein RCOM_0371350 [Ricinus communis]
MDQAIEDGAYVISLSIGITGYAPQYDHDPIAIDAFGATQHGIIVSYSAVYGVDVSGSYGFVDSLSPSKVQRKIVVCNRRMNARGEKGSVVKLAGGFGMILANIVDSDEELIVDSHLIPATMMK